MEGEEIGEGRGGGGGGEGRGKEMDGEKGKGRRRRRGMGKTSRMFLLASFSVLTTSSMTMSYTVLHIWYSVCKSTVSRSC